MEAVEVVTVVCLLAGVLANPNSPEDAKHIGCYVTPPNKIQTSKAPLSWSQCVHFCSHRSTRFAGIQAEATLSSMYNLCYCVDHLEELSTNVSSSLCQPCVENTEKFCGGNHTMSLYQLCDSQCSTLLLATSVGVMLVTGNSTSSVGGYTSGVRSLDFHYANDGVFFLTNEGTFGSFYYNPFTMRYADQKVLSRDSFTEISVDWLYNNSYLKDTYNGRICNTSLLSYYRSTCFDAPDLVDVTIDPYRRLLFFISYGQLFSYHIEDQFRETYTSESNFEVCQNVVLDIGQRTIYMICEENDQYHLLSVDYDDKNLRLLFNGPQLSKPTAFDVFDGEVVWANKNNDQHYVLYRCKLNPGCLQKNLETILELNEAVNDLKIYHPQELTFSPCASLNCSYNCTAISPDKGQCTCPETLRLGADNKTCQGTQKSSFNVTYVGCYSTSHPDSSLYKVQHSLSWEECVALCDNRMTRYVGVQQEESAPTYNFPYCMNSFDERFQMVNMSLCRACVEDTDRYCGGHKVMSVYKLRDSAPLAILLATDSGVSMFSSDTSSTTKRTAHTSPVTNVDFHYLKDKIFFLSQYEIRSSLYNPLSMSYLESTALQNEGTVRGMAVDWLFNRTYIAIEFQYITDGYKHAIQEGDLNGQNWKKIYNNNGKVQEMVVDPYYRILFFIEDGILFYYSLYEERTIKIDTEKSHIKELMKLALDISQQTVYTIGVDGAKTLYVMKIGYTESTMRMLYSGPQLTKPFGLGVFGDKIVWGNRDGGQCTLYTCQLSPRCRQEDIKVIHKQIEPIHDIKIYQPNIQTPNLTNLCSKINCSHKCDAVSLSSVKCTCPEGMTIGADKTKCDRTQKSSFNMTYLGCYSTSHPDSSLYKVQHSLSWEECVALCDNRMTRYVGVQEEESDPTYTFPYCMNSLDERFQEVNSSLCYPCAEDTERYCGRRGTIAVYQLRESVPLVVLLATISGVSMFSSVTSSTTKRTNYSLPVTIVDFHYLEDKIYFLSESKILSSIYNPLSMSYLETKTITSTRPISSLTVDWVNNRTFVATSILIYEGYGHYLKNVIQEGDLKGENWTNVHNYTGHVEQMVVDPYNRILFFIEDGILSSYGLDDKTLRIIDNEKSHIKKVMYLALDITQETVFMIGIDGAEKSYLMKIGYSETKTKMLYSGPELTNPFGLYWFENKVIWGNADDVQETLYVCQLTPRCRQEDIKVIYKQIEPIHDIKIYQPNIQTPNLTILCSKRKCSHKCDAVSLSAVQCTCPEGMTMGADKKTCRNTTTSTLVASSQEPKEMVTTEVAAFSEGFRILQALPIVPEETSSEDQSSTVLSDEEHLDYGLTRTVKPQIITMTTVTKEQQRNGIEFPVSNSSCFEVIDVLILVINVAIFGSVIYLIIKLKSSNRHFGLSYKPASEMEELTNTFNI